MQVPTIEETIPMATPGVAAPTIQPVTQKAFGEDIGAAQSGFGATLSAAGQTLGRAVAQRQAFDQEQQVHDALQPIQKDMFQKTHGMNQDANGNNIPGYAIREGVQAKGSTAAFDDEYGLTSKTYTEAAKQFKNPHQRALFQNQYQAIYTNHRDGVVSNEARQTQVADDQGVMSAYSTAGGAAAVNPNVLPGNNGLLGAAADRARELWASRVGKDKAEEMIQRMNDDVARQRLQLFPNDAEKLMTNLDLSPEGKAYVRGVQLDQTVKKDFAQPGTMPDGSHNLAEVEAKYKDPKSGMNSDEAQKAVENFSSMEARADRVLNDDNKANSAKFLDIAANPATPLEDAKKAAMQYVSKMRNGQIDHDDLATKLRYIDMMNKEANGVTDPEVYNRLREGIDKSGDVTPSNILDEHDNGNLSKSSVQSLTQFLYSQKSSVMQNRFKLIEGSKMVPKSQVPAFLATLHEEAITRRITNPDDLQSLAESLAKDAPTGNPFWSFSWGTQKEFKSAGVMSQHPDIVRAAGSPTAAAAFAQRVGGIAKFDKKTDYPGAVSYLLGKGWTLDNMAQESIEKVAAKLAEKAKATEKKNDK